MSVPASLSLGGVLALQATAGNDAVASMLQRQVPIPAPASGVTAPPAVGGPPPTAVPDFGNSHFLSGGPRFDLEYQPVGPLPQVGKVTVKLKVHVIFKDFDRTVMRRKDFAGHRWTRAQLRDFKWPEDQKAGWVAKFAAAVKSGWAEKHAFVLDAPDFAKYRATFDVAVQGVDDPKDANNTITAQWVPRGAPRIRSFVNGNTSELDVRDVDETETTKVKPASVIRQVGGFDNDSAELNSEVVSGMASFEEEFKKKKQAGGPLAVPPDDIDVVAIGRSTKAGSRRHNKDLGALRAEKVANQLMDDLGLAKTRSLSFGERNASDEPSFRRVDVRAIVGGERQVTQNTAAHEAGHMFGLGDEYIEEDAGPDSASKFAGDAPSHYEDVRTTMGEDAANDLLVQDGPNIMSTGSDVKPGHYVYFLQALNTVTNKTWKVE